MCFAKKIMIVIFILLLSACSPNVIEQNKEDIKERLLKKTEVIFSSLMNKDWEEFAQHVHADRGIVYSPFANVGDPDDLQFSKEDIEGFGEDQTKYVWSWDQSDTTFAATPNGFVENFVKKHHLDSNYELIYGHITFNQSEIGSGGSQTNTINEIFPDAIYVEYFHEPEEEYWHFWQALRFVYEEIEGEWYLVALVRGAHNP